MEKGDYRSTQCTKCGKFTDASFIMPEDRRCKCQKPRTSK